MVPAALGVLLAVVAADADEPLPQPLPAVADSSVHPDTPAKIELGRRLFFDPRLSRTDQVACATCHDPQHGFAEAKRIAVGVDGCRGSRNTPSLINVVYAESLMWDGRAASLEEQALLPIENPCEMDLPLATLERKLQRVADYHSRFRAVFGGEVTAERVAAALAAYERTLVCGDTPFDRYLAGETEALTPAARRGMELFYGAARCSLCHSGPNLSDGRFHNVGIVGGEFDAGRAAVTGKERDRGAFRTPQLREIGKTAPYMHDGRFDTLREVVQHYNFGGVADAENPHRDPRLQVLYLGDEAVDDLVAFLAEGLTTR